MTTYWPLYRSVDRLRSNINNNSNKNYNNNTPSAVVKLRVRDRRGLYRKWTYDDKTRRLSFVCRSTISGTRYCLTSRRLVIITEQLNNANRRRNERLYSSSSSRYHLSILYYIRTYLPAIARSPGSIRRV